MADGPLVLIDVSTMRGLEIGPLHRPKVRKDDGPVSYVDYYSTEELRHRYSANTATRLFLDDIVDVDYVVKHDQTLSDATKEGQPFDYVIASHVIEHVANPLGWMADAARALRAGGVLSLVVPDKRYSFDVNRVETQMREWVDWYVRDVKMPQPGQLYDFFANVTTIDGGVDTKAIWAGTADYAGVRRADVSDPDLAAIDLCRAQWASGEYIDVHGSVYTPISFLALLEISARIGLLDYELGSFETTERDDLEFYVSLRRLPADAPRGTTAQAATFRQAREAEVARGEAVARAQVMSVSERERQLLERKRRLLEAARRRLPRRGPPDS